jgi:hypothetical protein
MLNRLVAINYRRATLDTLLHVRKLTLATTVLLHISYRGAMLSHLPRESLISTSHNRLETNRNRTTIPNTLIHGKTYHNPQQVNISNRGDPLSTLQRVCRIPTSDNRPSASRLKRSVTDHSPPCISLTSTCKSHSYYFPMAQL